jgi:hypothetical protein
MRPSVSALPPGANGTTMRTVFTGHVWAVALAAISAAVSENINDRMRHRFCKNPLRILQRATGVRNALQ